MPRTLALSKPFSANSAFAAARITARVSVVPGLRPARTRVAGAKPPDVRSAAMAVGETEVEPARALAATYVGSDAAKCSRVNASDSAMSACRAARLAALRVLISMTTLPS